MEFKCENVQVCPPVGGFLCENVVDDWILKHSPITLIWAFEIQLHAEAQRRGVVFFVGWIFVCGNWVYM